MKTADLEQTHSLWMTIWNFISRFNSVFSAEEVQKAITSVNQPKTKHPFWGKLKEALWTLVILPKEKGSFRFLTQEDIARVSTGEWLKEFNIAIDPDVKRELPLEQPVTFAGANCLRLTYDADDLYTLGKISQFFPGLAETPFDAKTRDNEALSWKYTLSRIGQFISQWNLVHESDTRKPLGMAICEPDAENIFVIQGRKGPITVSARRKLNTWRIRRLGPGDGIRGPNAYVFI